MGHGKAEIKKGHLEGWRNGSVSQVLSVKARIWVLSVTPAGGGGGGGEVERGETCKNQATPNCKP